MNSRHERLAYNFVMVRLKARVNGELIVLIVHKEEGKSLLSVGLKRHMF